MKRSWVRAVLFFAVLGAVLVLPWWLSTLILVALTIYFPLYLELLFFGLVFDALYSTRFSFPYTGLSLATIFLILVTFARTRIRT